MHKRNHFLIDYLIHSCSHNIIIYITVAWKRARTLMYCALHNHRAKGCVLVPRFISTATGFACILVMSLIPMSFVFGKYLNVTFNLLQDDLDLRKIKISSIHGGYLRCCLIHATVLQCFFINCSSGSNQYRASHYLTKHRDSPCPANR